MQKPLERTSSHELVRLIHLLSQFCLESSPCISFYSFFHESYSEHVRVIVTRLVPFMLGYSYAALARPYNHRIAPSWSER